MRHESKVIPFTEPQSDVQISSKFPVETKQGGRGGRGGGEGRRKIIIQDKEGGKEMATDLARLHDYKIRRRVNKTGASAPEASAEVG